MSLPQAKEKKTFQKVLNFFSYKKHKTGIILKNQSVSFAAKPFLEMADDQGNGDDTCPGGPSIVNSTGDGVTPGMTLYTVATGDEFNPISWTYVIAGSFTIVTGILLLITALLKVDGRIKQNNFDRLELLETGCSCRFQKLGLLETVSAQT